MTTLPRTQIPTPIRTIESHQNVIEAIVARLRQIAPEDSRTVGRVTAALSEIAQAIADHVALADPHTQYLLETAVIAVAQLTNALPQFLHVRDEKPTGTAGGTFTNGAWRTRTLNTVKTNTITGASLAADQITLPAGSYEILAHAPAHPAVDQNQAKLYNVGAVNDAIIGTSGYYSGGSFIRGAFSLGVQRALEIRHRCNITKAPDGLGVFGNWGVNEVYAEVMIWKLPWL